MPIQSSQRATLDIAHASRSLANRDASATTDAARRRPAEAALGGQAEAVEDPALPAGRESLLANIALPRLCEHVVCPASPHQFRQFRQTSSPKWSVPARSPARGLYPLHRCPYLH